MPAIAVRRALAVGAALASVLAAAAAPAETAGNAEQGLEFARRTCSSCHAVERDGRSAALTMAASFVQIANTPGMTGAALNVWFHTPHPNMPNFILAPRDRDNVIAYIVSLKQPP